MMAFVKLYDDGRRFRLLHAIVKTKPAGSMTYSCVVWKNRSTMNEIWPFAAKKIIELLTSQNKLTDELNERINQAASKLELEDIYLPYRPPAAHWQPKPVKQDLSQLPWRF